MPAKNAPSARDKPAAWVSAADESATNSTARVNSSGERALAISLNMGRNNQRPPASMAAVTAMPLTRANTRSTPISSSPEARAGITIRKGMTARSWNNKMPTAARPCRELISDCSAKSLITMAVDDMAKTPPMTKAAGNESSSAHAARPATRVVMMTCAPPMPNTALRMELSLLMENSSPRVNSRKTTPNSASTRVFSDSATQPSAWGPISAPTPKYANIGGKCIRRNTVTAITEIASKTRTSIRALWCMVLVQ